MERGSTLMSRASGQAIAIAGSSRQKRLLAELAGLNFEPTNAVKLR